MGKPIFGMITNPSRDIMREIHFARRLGFDYVELGLEVPEGHHVLVSKKRKQVLRALVQFPYPPVAHTAYWYELYTDYEEVRQAWLDIAKKNISLAADLGCRKFNIHAPIMNGLYKYSRVHKKKAIRNEVSSLKELVRYAKPRDIRIVLENIPDPENMPFREYRALVERVPGMGVHLDTGHAFLEGGLKAIRKYIRTFGKQIEHIHASDNLGLADDHLGIGHGIIDYVTVFELLRKICYSHSITLEVFTNHRDLRDSLKLMRMIVEEVWPA